MILFELTKIISHLMGQVLKDQRKVQQLHDDMMWFM